MAAFDRVRPMMARSVRIGAALSIAAITLAACSSSSSSSTTTSPPSTAAPLLSTSTTTSSQASAKNLPITDAIRSELVAARAAQVGIPPATYLGLTAGSAYFALDTATNTYWAAAQMAVPSTSAAPGTDIYKAQVSSQDDGGYLVFSRPSGGTWTVSSVGMSGAMSPCPVTIPASVVKVWGWPAGSCHPTGY